jgi:hypothetical protein
MRVIVLASSPKKEASETTMGKGQVVLLSLDLNCVSVVTCATFGGITERSKNGSRLD